MKFPMDGKPHQKLIVIEPISHGQPRPYADHERIDLVTIRYYDHRGNLQDHCESYESMMRQNAFSAVGGDWVSDRDGLVHPTPDPYAWPDKYLESIENVGPNQVRVVVKEPYVD